MIGNGSAPDDGVPDNGFAPDDVGHLLRLAAAGDQRAWNGLVERFSGLLWSISRSYALSPADAADVFQLTWLRLLEHLDAIESPDRLVGWLATTCRRECLALLRRNKRTQPSDDDVLARLAEPVGGADEPVILSDRDAAIWRAFGRLQQRCQEILRVLLLATDDRVSYEWAATVLGVPIGSLGPTRARCLAKLRKLLDTEGIRGRPADS
jgi:RNA polymerase sigma factor (sigma-70 family)